MTSRKQKLRNCIDAIESNKLPRWCRIYSWFILSTMSCWCFFSCHYKRLQTGQWFCLFQKRVLKNRNKHIFMRYPETVLQGWQTLKVM